MVDVTGKVGGYRLVWNGVFFVTFGWAYNPVLSNLTKRFAFDNCIIR